MIATALLVATVVLLWGSLKYRLVVLGAQPYDYDEHIRLAEEIARTGQVRGPHFLTEALVIAVTWLIPGVSFRVSAWLVDTLASVAVALVIYGLLRGSVPEARSPSAALTCTALTLGLLLAWPITALFPLDGHLYFGYLGTSNVYHNPSQIVLKPLALLLFWHAGRVFSPPGRYPTATSAALLALLTVLATIAKPSYTICLLPALALAALYQLCSKGPLNWPLAAAGIIAPALIILGWQYLVAYGSVRSSPVTAGIVVAPLVVFSAVSSWIGLKFVLSILFPACVAALYFSAALGDARLRFAWLAFLVGAGYTYLLAESGGRQYPGNFAWSGQITSFVLFVATAVFLVRQHPEAFAARWAARRPTGRDWRLLACLLVLAAHVASGIVWYRLYWLGSGVARGL